MRGENLTEFFGEGNGKDMSDSDREEYIKKLADILRSSKAKKIKCMT